MMKKFDIEGFNCTCVSNDTCSRVVYMIYPQVNEFTDEWLEDQAEKNDWSIVVVYVPLDKWNDCLIDKWNDCLTPWPEPGETPKAEPFGGKGAEFLNVLQTEIISQAEKALGLGDITERDLIGVSLAGLFTLWQWVQSDTFRSIACLSGSFWYEGFIDWLERQTIPQKQGHAYFLLGTEEPKAYIKAYRYVGVNTEAVVARLQANGTGTTFDWVPGNHFANPLQRAEKALKKLNLSK